MPGFFKIYTRVIPPKYKSKKDYVNRIEKKLAAKNGEKNTIELAELQYYIFDSRQLGWMNCDMFINTNPETSDFVVNVPKSENIFTKIVFLNYKAVMTGNEIGQQFVFENLPINEPVKVVVLDKKNGKPLLKIVDTKTSKAPFTVSGLTEYTLSELQEKLKEIN